MRSGSVQAYTRYDYPRRTASDRVQVEGIIGCDLKIAEITSLNAHVVYELGPAHALRRPTLILSQGVGNAPFDLEAYRLMGYSDNYRVIGEVKTQRTRTAAQKPISEERSALAVPLPISPLRASGQPR